MELLKLEQCSKRNHIILQLDKLSCIDFFDTHLCAFVFRFHGIAIHLFLDLSFAERRNGGGLVLLCVSLRRCTYFSDTGIPQSCSQGERARTDQIDLYERANCFFPQQSPSHSQTSLNQPESRPVSSQALYKAIAFMSK